MARCVGWQPVLDSPHRPIDLPPGSCQRCWRPCRNAVEARGQRCNECLDLLAMHESSQVRFLLADDPSTPRDVLELLATDSQAGVAQRARSALAELGADPNATTDVESVVLDMEAGW